MLQNSELMSVAEFIFKKTGEVFNSTKFIVCLVVSLGVWKISRADIFCTPAASYFHYYVMPRSFYQSQESLICIYFVGGTGKSLLRFCLIIFFQGHLLFPIVCANTNYIFLNWGFIICICLLNSKISEAEVFYLLASSIQQIIQYCSCFFQH